jgi:hypothetical protein
MVQSYLSVCLYACNNPRTAERIVMEFDNGKFKKFGDTFLF